MPTSEQSPSRGLLTVAREERPRHIHEELKAYFVFFVLLLGIPPIGICDELAERAGMERYVVEYFSRQDFAALERQASEYRNSKGRTSSGLWKLTIFYGGISNSFDIRRKDESFWSASERSAKSWVTQFPKSPTAHLVYAQYLLNRGWSYRGGGYAGTVEPQNWQPFRQYTQEARQYLESTKSVASSDPRWYELMGIVGYRQSWNEAEFLKLMEEGLSQHPSFYQLYFVAIDYYAPKWGGNASAIEAFARDALRRTEAAEGFGMYARIYWYASQIQYYDRLFSDSLVDWPVMKRGIDDVLKKYPDAWNVNNFAKFACLSRDKAKTAELMKRIDGPPILQAWGRMQTFQDCKAWAFA